MVDNILKSTSILHNLLDFVKFNINISIFRIEFTNHSNKMFPTKCSNGTVHRAITSDTILFAVFLK